MIVSHEHKLIFIKTLKTAGTSVEAMLAKSCGPNAIVTPIFPEVQGHQPRNFRGWFPPWREVRSREDLRKNLVEFRRREKFYNHIPARFARARLPREIWDSYLKICVERNPWDKTLSHFQMFRHADWHQRYDPTLTLDKYLERGIFCHNARFYCDAQGKVIVDRVLRYDQLDADLIALYDELGMKYEGLPNAKAGIRTDKRSYREVFSDAQRERIQKEFSHEIALFNWKF